MSTKTHLAPETMLAAVAAVAAARLPKIFCPAKIVTPARDLDSAIPRSLTRAPWAIAVGTPWPDSHETIRILWPDRRHLKNIHGHWIGEPLPTYRVAEAWGEVDRDAWDRDRLRCDEISKGTWHWGDQVADAIGDLLGGYATRFLSIEIARAIDSDWPDVLDGLEMVEDLRGALAAAGYPLAVAAAES